jgi:glucose/arabinose dehydrogenase
MGSAAGALLLVGCGDKASLPLAAGFGPAPTLPAARASLIPTVLLTPAVGWPAGARPTPAADLQVSAYATNLSHPRWLYVLPNGDVLVAETGAPSRPDDESGISGFISKRAMQRVGAADPSAERITLLRGVDANGAAVTRSPFLSNLHSPFGMALVGTDFYVANTDAVLKFAYRTDALRIDSPANKVVDLPAGSRNHHWTKNLLASVDGTTLYVTVGSNSNVAENGLAAEHGRACIWEVDLRSGAHTVFASGLRNPNGLAWQPESHVLWTVVNERDELGSDLVPDYLTAVQAGAFYGWPYGYFGAHVDERVQPPRPDLLRRTRVPDYALGPHTASLGLTFASGQLLPARWRNGAFVGQHGSWNRIPLSGYQVIFIPFVGGRPSGAPQVALTGFVNAAGEAMGRPVGVAMDATGALLVADDVGNTVWRVSPRQL